MGAYQYQALNKSGSSSKGVIEADSERQARQLLREQGLVPTHIRPLAKQQQSRKKDKISAQDLALLTRQLATLLAAGIPVEESLRGVSEQTEKDRVRGLIIGVRSKVLEGYALAQAMGEFPNAFPELYRATVGAGEQTGRLDLVLEKLADYTENQQGTKQKIQQALIYPILMIVVSTGIISFLLAFVVPKIIEVFSSSGQSLPAMTQVLITLSDLIKSYGLIILGVFVALLAGFKKSLANLKVRTVWHKILLKLPITSYLVRSVNVARYIHTFGILFAAGVSVLETMRVSASLLTNLIMRNAFDIAANRVREGAAISQSLKDTGFLNPMAVHLIASGEKSGQIASMMEKAASHMDNEVKRLIDTALTLLEPLVILFMGAVVLFIVLATLLPVFSMEQLVG
ncbi:General secretion pathway protein F [Legionella massiliensis]|uniref:General secretion pathway protein F n=1 Tax=Legionella massiliensis TaxID=1034943 RepID=A0A078KZR9_9GAMM|nr:GspF family T2SS innner membrane protein variant LspF [Legionella massiliensis]CDZ78401.1 General secretion pathway protein F [Legionella massiliensis]CEE14139.1 Type II secretion system protein F [Legionella massiliensis]